MERLCKKTNESSFEVFNVGTGKGFSVFEVIKTFEKVSGKKLSFRIANKREGDVEQIYADCRLSNKSLGWETKLTLEDGIRDSWNWQLSIQ